MKAKTVVFSNNSLYFLLQFRLGIIKDFSEKGWNIVIIIPASTVEEELLKALDPRWKVYQINVNPNDINPLGDAKYFLELLKIFRREKPDIVFQYTIKPNIYGTLACKMLGIKCISMVAGLGYIFEGKSLKKKIGRLLYKIGLRLSDRVFVLNVSNEQTLLKGKYVTPEKLILLKGGEGVNLKKYPYKPMEFKDIRFLMVARILFDKGYNEYVEAAKILRSKYPEVECELLGPLATDSPMGVPEERVRKDNAAGYIKYCGTTQDVPSYVLRDGVVIVLPSKYLEGLNRSLMEACAMGRPIITTDNPGCVEAVDNGKNGILVPVGDSRSLAQAMMDMIEKPREEKIKMSKASRELALNLFNEDIVIESYWHALQDIGVS
ncbi:MAG: glycosyltransferase family 4 protein [Bacteroides sp.]|nr:glycosyltransferase family 4 protein [Bacteroides sp.]